MTDITQRQYAQRDHMAQGNYYVRHVYSMTGEALHAKSAIAAELAHRDIEIDRLRAALRKIADLDPAVDSDKGYNEWGETDCFRQAQEAARAALGEQT